jgi:hypothetical protein
MYVYDMITEGRKGGIINIINDDVELWKQQTMGVKKMEPGRQEHTLYRRVPTTVPDLWQRQ